MSDKSASLFHKKVCYSKRLHNMKAIFQLRFFFVVKWGGGCIGNKTLYFKKQKFLAIFVLGSCSFC